MIVVKRIIGWLLLTAFVGGMFAYIVENTSWIVLLELIGSGVIFTAFLYLIVWLIFSE